MDAVGHVPDGYFFHRPALVHRLKQVTAYVAMQGTYTIHRPAPAYRQIGHVERFQRIVRMPAAQGQQIAGLNAQFLLGIRAKVLRNERRVKTVKTGHHRRVRREKVPGSGDGQCVLEGQPGFLHAAPRALQNHEGRMPLIQVTDLRLEAKRLEHPPATDPEQYFLLETQLGPAAI